MSEKNISLNASLKHESESECQLCLSKIKTAHFYLQVFFLNAKKKFPNLHCSWAWRGAADQDLFFNQGKSRVRFPNSTHNAVDSKKNPCSRALDLFSIDDDSLPRWSMPWFKLIADYCKEEGLKIEWGGDWPMRDGPHFQLKKEVEQP